MAITRMTFAQARKYVDENNERLQTAYDKAEPAPFVDDGLPPQIIARGLAEFEEYLKRRDKERTTAKNQGIDNRSQHVGIRTNQAALSGAIKPCFILL